MFRRSLALVATLAAALALSGAAAAQPVARAADDGYPVTVTAANGPVTLTRKPRRIVSLSPTATETLFAIGAGPQVVAVDDQSSYPRQAPRTSLSGFTPNVEAIASYRPDLVVISFDPKGLADSLARLKIPVVYQKAAATLAGAYQQIRQLGLLTGHRDAAQALIRRMQRQIAAIVAARRGVAAGKTVYHELDPTLFSATSKTFIGRIYALFGLRNIADAADSAGSGYPQLSAEYVIEQSPDLIVLADGVCCGQTPRTVAARPGWDSISAVRTGSIVRVDDSVASRWGPRLVQFVQAVGRALARLAAR